MYKLFASICIFFLWAIGRLPLQLRQVLGRFLGSVYALFPTEAREVAELQIGVFLPTADRKKLAQKVFSSFGQSFLEITNLAPLFPNRSRVQYEFSNPTILEDLIASKHETKVFLTAHTGNWELLAVLAQHTEIPIAAIGTEAQSKFLRPVLEWLRRESGIETLWRGKFGAKDVLATLQRGVSVAGVIDQDTKVRSLPSPFFGQPASTPSTLVKLALEHQFPLFSVFIFRKSAHRFVIILDKISGSTPEEILFAYNLRLESAIREYPDQWVWFHKRWRSDASGNRISGKLYREQLKERLRLGGQS